MADMCIQNNYVCRLTHWVECRSPFHLTKSWLRIGQSMLWVNSPSWGFPHPAQSQSGWGSPGRWDKTYRCSEQTLAGPDGFSLQMELRPSGRSPPSVWLPLQMPGEKQEHECSIWPSNLKFHLKKISAFLLLCQGYWAWSVHIWRGWCSAGLYCWWRWLSCNLGLCNPLHLTNLCTSTASSSSDHRVAKCVVVK